jgi:DNA integrity scanning protein DisA with diadenylate cyclase activity
VDDPQRTVNVSTSRDGGQAELTTASERRIGRLRDELRDEGVPLPLDGDLGSTLLDEIQYARRPQVHERHVPRYGSLIFPDHHGGWMPAEVGAKLVALPETDLRFLRRFADGRGALLVRRPREATQLATFEHTITYEASLVDVQRASGAYLVQRSGDGSVRIFTEETIVTWDGVRWRAKPPARRFEEAIRRVVEIADPTILAGILEVCVHWLSPSYVGTTIVWYCTDEDEDDRALMDLSLARRTPPLRLDERSHLPPLLSALRQVDGAATVSAGGTLRHVRVFLRPSEKSTELVPAIQGTRHTSARRFSYDEPRALVFVVSEDGPVSVFADGARIALVRTDRSWMVAPRDEAGDGHRPEVECGTCGKAVVVDAHDDAGPDASRERSCPVCGSPIETPPGPIIGVTKDL